MCGRFTLRTPPELFVQLSLFSEEQFVTGASFTDQLGTPRYNIAPSQSVLAVRHRSMHAQALAGPPLECVHLRWGLIPYWADDAKIGYRMINARAETIATKPSFRQAFVRRRCLVLADGFYEWKPLTESRQKQPYLIECQPAAPFAFAGLWERWNKGDQPIESCTIITTTANERLQDLHDRMPVILPPELYEPWLDPELRDREALQDLLKPYSAGAMQFRPVSRVVNSPKNDGPACVGRVAD